MANWLDIKNEYEVMIEKSGVTNPEFIKTFMTIARRLNTCRNLLYVGGYSWEYMTYTKPFNEASDLMQLLNGHGYLYNKKEAKFWNEWKQFADANGWVDDGNVGDWLA
jgi:hypothetical protein